MSKIEKIQPSHIFTNYIFKAIPLAFDESMSYYETLCGVLDLLHTHTEVINNNANVVAELETYVEHYFDNLDVQEEINNKLDEMAENGELTDIIAQYLQLAGVLAYYRKADLKGAENLVNGSIAKTLGDSVYSDGLGSFYRIRTLTIDDVVDDDHIVALTNYPTLIAEKIPDGKIGELTNLTTTSKTNVVSAINEVNAKTNNHKFLYGIIRPTSEGWTILEDTQHTPVNLDSVSITDGNLIIHHSHDFTKVNSFQITPDETFAKYGITAGASVGLNSSRIEIFQNLHAGGFIRTNTGTPVIQTDYNNLIDSVSFSTNHLIVVFNEDLTGCYPNDWEAKFAGSGQIAVQQANKPKFICASLVSNRRLDIYCLLGDNTFSTDITDFDRVIVTMNYCKKINPQQLVDNTITGANFWIEGTFE